MSETVSDFMIKRLQAWGIERVYGYSGDGINGMMAALRRAEPELRMIQPQHEEIGAFMATGHAKFTGQPGVCISTSGPGAVHLLNGLYDAKKDHVPVVAIIGQQARKTIGTDYQQEIDLGSLYKDVAGDYVHVLSDPPQARHLVDQAVRIAIARRTVTAIIVPNDVQDLPMEEPTASDGVVFSGTGYRRPHFLPKSEDLDEAAELLNAGEKVAILAGAGCKNAVDDVLALAEKLGAGVAKALLAKVMIPDDVEFVTGTMGLLGTRPSQDMMNECDTLLMVGTRFPYAEFLPVDKKVRAIQIDLDAEALGLRFPTEINLHGDAAATLQALTERVNRKEDRSWQQTLVKNTHDWWELMGERASQSAKPINPQQVFWSLNQRLPDNALLASDVGSATNWYARYLKVRRGMHGSVSGGLASMGNGIPYLLAAKFAFPDQPGIAMVGDGAMQMLGNQALIGVAKYWQEWEDPRCIILVLNNRDLSQVSWEQRVMEGDPKYESSQDLMDFAYDSYADMLGLKGLRMSTPEDVDRVWDEALAADRPVVINAYVDPEVGPLPPHINLDQAKGFLASMIKGDPSAWRMIKQSFKQIKAG
ncbi:MAG: thiamine pyrophosphate-requiring protein [Marinobacter sp.]|uniref:thiamine pyrophosphate-requiring protein n=1 Tax=Marinobacter sp. TaxID=50741 RepID=UPI003F9D5AD9